MLDALRAIFTFSLSLLLCLASLSAAAPPRADRTSPEVRERARAAFDRGRRLYRLTQFKEALDQFVQAYTLLEEPAFIYNIAQCRRQLGQDAEALRAYESFLAQAPPDDEGRADVEIFIRDLAVRIARRHADEERSRRVTEERALIDARTRELEAEVTRLRLAHGGVRLSKARTRGLIVSGSVFTFAGLGLVGGGLASALALHDATGDLRQLATTQAPFDPSIEQRRDRAMTATISLFSIGGVLVVTGAGLLGRGLVERRMLAAPPGIAP